VYLARWLWRGLRKAWGDMTYLNERLLFPPEPSEAKESLAWREALGGRVLAGGQVGETSHAHTGEADPQRRKGGRAA